MNSGGGAKKGAQAPNDKNNKTAGSGNAAIQSTGG